MTDRPVSAGAILRFFSKVDLSGGFESCWNWTGRKHNGYGGYQLGYKIFFGYRPRRPFGLDHLCRNRGCCNPYHLEVVSIRENIRRGENHVAEFMRKTHCIRGHLLTEENLYPNEKFGRRNCKLCQAVRDDRRDTKKRRIRQCTDILIREGQI